MINEENLNKLYNALISNKELTTKELNSYGFNSKDLNDLIENGTIERIKRGYYSFLSVDTLFYYGKELISLKKYDEATACFEKCYELNPDHLGVCFQLFLRAIQSKDYSKAFIYFEHFYNNDNEYYNNDSNFYLYLLNMITEIPEQHRQYAKYLKLKDMKIDLNDKRFKNPYYQNKVIISAYNQKFSLALKQLDELVRENGRMIVYDIVVKTLLFQALEKQNKLKKNIVNFAINKDYNGIISRLNEFKENHHLSEADQRILFLAEEIIDYQKTNKIPDKKITNTDNLFEAINGKNFPLALNLSKQYNEKNNINPNDNAIYILLNEITELIKTKSSQSIALQEQPVKTSSRKVEEETMIKPSIPKTNPVSMTSNTTFATVIEYLIKQDFDNLLISLKKYLNDINKSEYEFLIIDLIKISLIEQDMAFSKPMMVLTHISKEKFNFDISEYIQNFYVTLAQNKLEEARIYLDIIAQSNKIGQNCVLTEGLEQVLHNTEKMLNYTMNNEILDKIDTSIKNVEKEPIIQIPIRQTIIQPEVQQPVENEPLFVDDEIINTPIEKSKKNTTLEISKGKEILSDYDDSKLIKGKLDELYEKGIVLLRPMDDNRIKRIHNIVNDIPDVVSFSIESDAGKQIVLRFRPCIDEYVDFSTIAKEGTIAYKNGEYDSCIDCYKRLLEFGRPKAYVYAKLGLAYMKKFDKKTAIDYFTIATALSKEEQSEFDFTELIDNLKGIYDRKPRVKMTVEDFKNDIDDYYGIENIETIFEMVTSGIDLDEVCQNLGLDNEQKLLVNLIFAREYYIQSNYVLGDKYLKKVEKTKDKSKLIKSLFEEIRKNKKFYQNRNNDDHKLLVMTLKK